MLNLTGGLFPLKLVDPAKEVLHKLSRITWTYSKKITGSTLLSSNAILKSVPSIIGPKQAPSKKCTMETSLTFNQKLFNSLTNSTVNLQSIIQHGLMMRLWRYSKNWKCTISILSLYRTDWNQMLNGLSKIWRM